MLFWLSKVWMGQTQQVLFWYIMSSEGKGEKKRAESPGTVEKMCPQVELKNWKKKQHFKRKEWIQCGNNLAKKCEGELWNAARSSRARSFKTKWGNFKFKNLNYDINILRWEQSGSLFTWTWIVERLSAVKDETRSQKEKNKGNNPFCHSMTKVSPVH